MKRFYDFNNLEGISDVLGMLLIPSNGSYIDRLSSDDATNRDSYFGWEIVKMLDELSDEEVSEIVPEYTIRNNSSGDIIEGCWNYEDAQMVVKFFDEEDIANGCFEENSYEIINRDGKSNLWDSDFK